jgi:hypothetical protein
LFAIFGVTLLGALWVLTRSWHAPILDRSEFRQLQTAVAVYWMQVDGFRLNYEFPIFGPPWSAPFEFPIYQWVVVVASRAFSIDLEFAARAVSIAFLGASLPAVYGLAGLLSIPPTRRLLVLCAVLAGPSYLFYGRTFMIETTALCFSVWFLYTLARAVRDDSTVWAVLAAAFAILAGLAKVTTLVVFLPPAALMTWPHWRQHWTRRGQEFAALRRSTLLAIVPVLVGLIVAASWVAYGDRVKDANPFAGFLTSTQLFKWNWGTIADRFSGAVWNEVWRNLTGFVIGSATLVLLAFCATLVTPSCRRAALGCAACFLSGPLLFSNLYFVHDYYYCANAIFPLAAAGILLAGIWDSPRLPLGARVMAVALFLGGQAVLFYNSYWDYHRRVLPTPPGIAAMIREVVPADDVVLIYGWDWNTVVPYYAQRRVISVPTERELDTAALEHVVAQLPPRRISALLFRRTANVEAEPEFLRERLRRFNLSPVPFATSVDGDLYLPKDDMPKALTRLGDHKFPGVTMGGPTTSGREEVPLVESDVATLAVPQLSPHPTHARSRYGVAPGMADGRSVIMAHPVSELQFTSPPGATQIEAVFGLMAAAYAPDDTSVTDGISVEIVEQRPNGDHRMLFHRDLDPARHPDDRGPQTIRLENAGPFSGPVTFRITAGPSGNYTKDWAYWERISIH